MSEQYLLLLTLYAISSFGAVLLTAEAVLRMVQPAIVRILDKLQPADAIMAHVAIRLIPPLVATLLTLLSAVPGFLGGEPIGTHERPGLGLWVLAAIGMFALLAPLARVAKLARHTVQQTHRWQSKAVGQNSFADTPVVELGITNPVLVASGVLRKTIFLSSPIRALLNDRELRAALRHEVAHCRQHHNLVKLVCAAAPRVFDNLPLDEGLWEVIEYAADDEACQVPGDALNLASAVLILAKQASSTGTPALYTAFVGNEAGPSIERRLQRLVRPACRAVQSRFPQIATISCMVAAIVALVGSLPIAQHGFRETLELMVR